MVSMTADEVDMVAVLKAREDENLDLVRRFFADWSQRDAGLLATYLADDLVYKPVAQTARLIIAWGKKISY
ncbi:MAG: hypothetical protein E2O50_04925 [Gammaproteobacteria bacterium]|nr:MAG: hypothetical protein E2O50_04925 [Gammaproteobacteria bacterium]